MLEFQCYQHPSSRVSPLYRSHSVCHYNMDIIYFINFLCLMNERYNGYCYLEVYYSILKSHLSSVWMLNMPTTLLSEPNLPACLIIFHDCKVWWSNFSTNTCNLSGYRSTGRLSYRSSIWMLYTPNSLSLYCLYIFSNREISCSSFSSVLGINIYGFSPQYGWRFLRSSPLNILAGEWLRTK